MKVQISTLDGALGYSPGEGPVYIAGPALQGPLDQVITVGDPTPLYPTFGGLKLPDRAAFHFSVGGAGPVSCLRIATSTAGSLPAYSTTIATALAANAAGNAFAGINFTGPRNIEVVFAATWDGGNVVLTGTDASGAAQTETVTAAAGSTVKGAKVFGTLTAAAKSAVGANAVTATLKTGNKVAAGAGSDAQLVASGTPNDDLDVVVKMTRAGDVGGPVFPAYVESVDGGNNFGAETVVPNGGSLALGNGVTGTLSGSAVKIGDTFRFPCAGPTSTTGNLTTALAVLSTLNTDGGELHILGGLSGSQVAAVISWRGTERSAGRDWMVYVETRDYTAGEADATYVASLLADYAGVTETEGAVAVIPGWYPTVLPGGRGIQRRSGAWAAVSQVWRLDFWAHAASQEDGGGALKGLFLPATPIAPPWHDERISPGLGGTAGRFMTLQSLPGQDNVGKLFLGDAAGLRSPGTLASGTSDWSLLMNARLGNRTRRIVQAYSAQVLAGRYATKANGTLTAAARLKLNGRASAHLKRVLGGAIQDVRVEFSATEAVKTTKKLPCIVYLNNWAYALEFDAAVGLLPVQPVA